MTKSIARVFDYSLPTILQLKFLFDCLKIIRRGYLTNDIYVKKLEHRLSDFFEGKEILCVSSGTSALQLLISCICGPKDHIIMPNNTFIATWQAARINDLNIHIVDTNESGIGLCPIKLEKVLNKLSTQSIFPKAIIDVHIGGFISKYWNECKNISERFGCVYLEDSAQAFGSETKSGFKAGCLGKAGIHSFHLTKVLTGGEGGSIVCNSDFIQKIKSRRQFGFSKSNSLLFDSLSLNSKMSEFVAAFISCNFAAIKNKINKRRKLLSCYKEYLNSDKFKVYDDNFMGSYSSAYKTIVKIKDESIYNRIINNSGAFPLTGFVYKYPLNYQPIVNQDMMTTYHGNMINSITFSKSHICPPNYPELTLSKVRQICDLLNNYC